MCQVSPIKEFLKRIHSLKISQCLYGEASAVAQRVRENLITQSKVKIVLYWGCIFKSSPDTKEDAFMELLQSLDGSISNYLGLQCEFNIVFTDTHAELNKVPRGLYHEYFNLVINAYLSSNIRFSKMSQIVGSYNPAINHYSLCENLGGSLDKLLLSDACNIHGNAESMLFVEKYKNSNIIESAFISQKWPDAIFFHPGPSSMKLLLPSLPILNGYTSMRKSKAKPWNGKANKS